MASMTRRTFLQNSALLTAGATVALNTPPLMAKPSMAFEEYRKYDGMGLAALVKSGDASPAELLDIAIARTEAVNPTVNAVVLKHYDLAREALKQSLPQGPFTGVPFLLKDLGIALNNTVTTHGSVFFKDAMDDHDSTLVERYKQAGLVIFGKTHSPEFGGSPSTESQLFGDTHNPWNLEHSAGGSSGGAGAAVAAGIIPAAHASDGGGSIRIPASANGLFGMKPSRGRVPMGPNIYESRNGLACQHVVSRSVRDSAALLDVTQGAAVGDAYAAPARNRPYLEEITQSPGKLRIALMTDPLLPVPVAPECVAAAEAAARLCESLGHHVEIAKPQVEDLEKLYNALGTSSNVLVAEKIANHEAMLGRPVKPEELEKITWVNLEQGRKTSAVEYTMARNTLHQASRTLGNFMQEYDLVLSPTMAMVPPKLGVLSLNQEFNSFIPPAVAGSAFTSLYNMTGQPAMSVPLHWTEQGLPVGVMFAARYGDEATLFRLAAQLEQAAPWFDRIAQL